MADGRIVVLSLVERGWQAARELSLDVQPHGVRVIHLIKGRLSHAVYQLITQKPHVRILSVPRPFFWPMLGLVTIGLLLIGRLRAVLVDNERSFRRLRGWTSWASLTVTMVQQGARGYELRCGPEPLSRAAWSQLVGVDASGPDL